MPPRTGVQERRATQELVKQNAVRASDNPYAGALSTAWPASYSGAAFPPIHGQRVPIDKGVVANLLSPPPMNGAQTLNAACEALQEEMPERLSRWLVWLRSDRARWVRIPLGVACVMGAVLWFLPVLGIELLPVGLLLLAQDVPWLRKPVGLFILFLVSRWRRLKRWFEARKRRRP